MPDAEERPILLDTHIWIWVMEGRAGEMHRDIRGVVDRAQAQGRIWISAISVWEIGILHARGRLQLAMDVREWVRRALAVPGVRLAELSPEIALDSSFLPGEIHGDPADRILVATARHLGATLVTRDAQLVRYSQQGTVAIMDAAP